MTEPLKLNLGKAKEEAEPILESQIPKPVGYHLLIAMPQVDDTYESGLIKSATTVKQESILSMVGAVIDMGDLCYSDESRFPSGPWCKVGDYVMFRSTSGTRFKVGGKEFRLMNDDSIEAIVEDPKSVRSV